MPGDPPPVTTELDTARTAGLRHYLDVLRRRRWLVLAVAAAAVAAAAIVSFVQPSVYRATTKVVIGQGNSLFQPQFGNAFQPFTATASDLVTSNVVAEQVIEELGLAETPDELLERTSVSINPETAVLTIAVEHREPEVARSVAQQTAETFSELFNERFGQASGDGGAQPLTATIWDPARLEPDRVSPRPVRNVAVAAVLGIVLGLLAAFLRDHFDRWLRTREEVEAAFGLPVIGQIPFRKARARDERRVFWSHFDEGAEAFRALRANLQYLAVRRPLRTILVTSASPEQGKTTVAANLAVAIARSGASTVVIEGDLRRPRLNDAFGVAPSGGGLTSVLVGRADVEEALVDVPFPEGEGGERRDGSVSLLPSGPLPPNPSELLSSAQMTGLLDRLAASHDFVLIDSPPLLLVADGLELARVVDGVVLVVRRNRASADEAQELRAVVERLGVNLVGVVFTDVPSVGAYGYGDGEARRELTAAARD